MKEYLSQKGVTYIEQDIANDEQAMEELVELGIMTTPVVKIDAVIVVGFDRKKLEALLD